MPSCGASLFPDPYLSRGAAVKSVRALAGPDAYSCFSCAFVLLQVAVLADAALIDAEQSVVEILPYATHTEANL